MNLDRMELADLVSPEALVRGILKQIPDLQIPVPIEQIALALDIVDIKALETQGFEGGLIAFSDKSEGTILVNKQSSNQRQRFTIGHELGHFLCPWHMPASGDQFLCKASDFVASDTPVSNKVKKMEAEANRFSAGLLIPMPHFRKDVRADTEPDLKRIWRLADKYDVSKEALGRRYVEVHDECCAFVASKNNQYLYNYRRADFPYIDLRRDQPLPQQSLSKTDRSVAGTITEWNDVSPNIWVSQDKKFTALYEQTVQQHDGYRVTLLHGELRDEDEEAEENELKESWTPLFRR